MSTEAQQSFLPDTPTSWLPGYPTLPLELFTLGFSFTILGAQSLVLCCGSLQRHLPHCGVGLPLYQEIFISSSFTLGVPQVHWLSDSFPWDALPSLKYKWTSNYYVQTAMGMHFNLFTSSELIGRNAEQYRLTKRELEVDPTWAERMCMGPIYCFHHLPSWDGATSGSHYNYERCRLHACSKTQLWFHNQPGEAGGK